MPVVGLLLLGRARGRLAAARPGKTRLAGGEAGNDRFSPATHTRDSILAGFGGDRAWVDRRLDTVLGVDRVYAGSAVGARARRRGRRCRVSPARLPVRMCRN